MSVESKKWFALTIEPRKENQDSDSIDTLCLELIELGVSGTAVACTPEIIAYIEGTDESCSEVAKKISTLDCEIKAINALTETNWTGYCAEVWEPMTIQGLKVTPVQSTESAPPHPAAHEILIIPGLGFGTGHHPTTRMMLSALQHPLVLPSKRSSKIIDIGTGSGILAIAASQLFQCEVTAIDIDEHALANAADNCALNKVSEQIHLSATSITDISNSYDVILANVYGEVLVSMVSDFVRISTSGTIALLSGITELVWPSVKEAFNKEDLWFLHTTEQDGEWMCAILERR